MPGRSVSRGMSPQLKRLRGIMVQHQLSATDAARQAPDLGERAAAAVDAALSAVEVAIQAITDQADVVVRQRESVGRSRSTGRSVLDEIRARRARDD